MTTLAYLVLDPERRVAARWSSPATRRRSSISPGRRAVLPGRAGGVALGVSRGSRYRGRSARCRAGSTLVLYTDGVVEVRGESIDDGLERLRQLAERGTRTSRSCATRSSTSWSPTARPADDVALLAARVAPLDGPPADALAGPSPERSPTSATSCAAGCAITGRDRRRDLRHHRRLPGGVRERRRARVRARASEAFEVEASPRRGARRDRRRATAGSGAARAGRNRGRGLPMMEALMDSVDVQHTAERHRRGAAAHARAGARRMSTLARLEDEWHGEIPVARRRGRDRRLERHGDRRPAARACSPTARSRWSSTCPRTTYLDSAGINLLFALADELRGAPAAARLVVADGSPIARMVTLTGLDQAIARAPHTAGRR